MNYYLQKFVLLCIICAPRLLIGQVTGVVTDSEGLPLPYVNIFIEGTTIGTATNMDGHYNLNVPQGSAIVFRYIGFEDNTQVVEHINQKINVELQVQSITTDEVIITADAEDPAYPIIRKAIAKRDYYKNQVRAYTVNNYAKGLVKMLDAPEKILGQEVGDLGGILDTTRQGIVYLSESESEVFVKANKVKEVMKSSLVSGSDGAFNINRLSNVQFDIYDQYFTFSRTVINPLADNAFAYYKYKLEGISHDDQGREVNKIAVIPKSNNRPVSFGYIYIVENSWNVTQLELSLTGKSLKEPIFDTIIMKQQFLPIGDDDVWRLFSQEINFKAGGFGFVVGGTFSNIFSNYDISPEIDDALFDNESFKMEKDAVKKDSAFWNKTRPVPLTYEEERDYIRKDSLRQIWESKEFMDSIDHKNNKFNFLNLIVGYDYNQSYKQRFWSISSPLNSHQFNTVEGGRLSTSLGFTSYDSSNVRRLKATVDIGYGIEDRKLKTEAKISYRKDRIHQEYFTLRIGDSYKQLNNANPVVPMLNTLSGLIFKENHIRLYRSKNVSFTYQRELFNGLYFKGTTGYENRSELTNNSDLSLFNKDKIYEENRPPNVIDGKEYATGNHTFINIKLRWRPGQKYASYPTFRIREKGYLPSLLVNYTKGLAILGDTDFDKINISIEDDKISLREYGYSKLNVSFGTFLNRETYSYIDQHHFLTNVHKIVSFDINQFRLMPHYIYSSTEDYISAHYEHHFNGYIMDKIPLLKNMGAKFVLGAKTLQMKHHDPYYETSIGVDQLKIGLYSVFRIDYSWSYSAEGLLDHGIFFGINTLFAD